MDNDSSVPEEFRFKGRQTIYKGIKMRSRLEATFAADLDRMALTWQYEPRCYANSRGQYLPDFCITDGLFYRDTDTFASFDGLVFVEVKPAKPDTEAIFDSMSIIWDSVPNAALLLWTPEHTGSMWVSDEGPGGTWEQYVDLAPCPSCGVGTLYRWTYDGPCGICSMVMAGGI